MTSTICTVISCFLMAALAIQTVECHALRKRYISPAANLERNISPIMRLIYNGDEDEKRAIRFLVNDFGNDGHYVAPIDGQIEQMKAAGKRHVGPISMGPLAPSNYGQDLNLIEKLYTVGKRQLGPGAELHRQMATLTGLQSVGKRHSPADELLRNSELFQQLDQVGKRSGLSPASDIMSQAHLQRLLEIGK